MTATPAIKNAPAKSPKAKRPKKSKAVKSSVKEVSEGRPFVQRAKKPRVWGDNAKSRMVRVDAGFADYLRNIAVKARKPMVEVTRDILESGMLES